MSNFKNRVQNRQNVMALAITISLADFLEADTPNTLEIPLPQDAEVVGGDVVVGTVFDTTGTDTIVLGDSGVANRHLNAVNLKAAARTALTVTGYRTDKDTRKLLLVRTPADANATEGELHLTIQYVVQEKGGFIQD